MERTEWLKQIRSMAEDLYDKISPLYWDKFGFYENQAHLVYLQKFAGLVSCPGLVLSAACGAGRFDGVLLEAGFSVVGIDQSAGMLRKAREHFPAEQYPNLRYEKLGLQEINFHAAFDGVICMDAMEHIFPEDYLMILRKFQEALKAGGVLYFTADRAEDPDFDITASYERARAAGLPVVFGEVADGIAEAYEQVKAQGLAVSGEITDRAVYHYYPPLAQVREWLDQAGLEVVDEGEGSGLYHIIARKR